MIFESFVGRERELAHLNALREEALRTRRGSVVSITGEPGIGKSRLLREFSDGFGRRFATGAARARDGASQPYATWQQLLSAITVPPRPAITAALAKGRLTTVTENIANPDERVAAIVNAICTIAHAAGGLTLVIDDVQFCDRASLEALYALADRIEEHSIVLVIAMRDLAGLQDLSRVATLGRIERLAATRIRLLPIHDDFLAPLLARALPAERVASVLRLAEGSPFAAEELGRAAAARSASSESIPLSLSRAILERLERLPAGAQDVLVRAAVLGRDFALEDLAHVVEAGEQQMLAALRSARDEQLIAEDPSSVTGSFRFRHALTREALYRRLLRVEATSIHTAVADRLECDAPERIAEIAFHRWSAGDALRAPAACVAAAERAVALGAPSDAVEQYYRALSFDSLEPMFISEVGSEAGSLLSAVMREEEAYQLCRTSRLRIDPARAPLAACRAIAKEANQAVQLFKFEESGRLFDEAERILREAPPNAIDPTARAVVTESRAISFITQGRYTEAREQLELTRSLNSDLARSDGLEIVNALLLFEEGRIDDSLAALEHCLSTIKRPRNLVIAALNLAYANWHLGRLDDAREATIRMNALASNSGYDAAGPTALAFTHLIDATQGRYRDALDFIDAQPPVEPATRLLLPTLRANLTAWTGLAPSSRLTRDFEAIGPTHINAMLCAGAVAWVRGAEPVHARNTVMPFLSDRTRYAFDFDDAAIAFCDESIARDRLERLEVLAQIPQHHAARAYALLGRARIAERTSQSIEASRFGREAASAFAKLGYVVQHARAAWVAREYDEARDILTAAGASGELARLQGRTCEPKAPSEIQLSRREEQVARAAATGASHKEIGLELGISARTVESHLQNVYAKLNMHSRVELARRFAQT